MVLGLGRWIAYSAIVVGVGAGLGATGLAQASQVFDIGYYRVDTVETYEIHQNGTLTLVHPGFLSEDVDGAHVGSPEGGSIGPLPSTGEPDLDLFLQLGKWAWKIVASNKPVVTIATERVSVVPREVSHWQELEGWDVPQARHFRSVYRNIYGIEMVSFEYRILYTPKGSRDGKGAYLSGVTILPSAVDVKWGMNFNAKASIVGITNAGTRNNPVAAVEIQMQWTLDTVFNHDERSFTYYVRGDGSFREIN